MEGLSPDLTTQQNACIITHSHTRVWPLILDSLGMVEEWLKSSETNPLLIKYKVLKQCTLQVYHCMCNYCVTYFMYIHVYLQSEDLHATLLKCMYNGNTLIITEVDTVQLAEDKILLDVLECRRLFHKAKSMLKIMV